MHRSRLLRAVLLLTSLVLAVPASAALRCGTEVIVEGDSAPKLLEACGEPTVGDGAAYLETHEWTYNFGPDELMFRVLIRDGEVERIENLGRGTARPVEETEGRRR